MAPCDAKMEVIGKNGLIVIPEAEFGSGIIFTAWRFLIVGNFVAFFARNRGSALHRGIVIGFVLLVVFVTGILVGVFVACRGIEVIDFVFLAGTKIPIIIFQNDE